MADFYRPPEYVKARKIHDCAACFHQIVPSENHVVQTGIYDGKAFRNRFHYECFDALCDDGEGEFMPGGFDPPERLRNKFT